MRAAHKKAPPARTGLEVTRATTLANNGSARGDAFATLLARLENVRDAGDGNARSQCPSCTGTSRKLSIRQGPPLLLHCFGGCGAADVLAAVGMQFSDLYDQHERSASSPAERRAWRRQAHQKAALTTARLEVEVLAIVARAMALEARIGGFDDSMCKRLELSADRLVKCQEVLA